MSAHGRLFSADVVIVTAIPLEFDALMKVNAGAVPDSEWQRERGPNGMPIALRSFVSNGRPLRICAGLANTLGSLSATNALFPLVESYGPRAIAMCGVCAGNPKKTQLGDVVIADRVFLHDAGKRKPEGSFQSDITTYNLRPDWKSALETHDFISELQTNEWWMSRPVSFDWQVWWLCAQLRLGIEDPAKLPEAEQYCSRWSEVLKALWQRRWLGDGLLRLTKEGEREVDRFLLLYKGRFPDMLPTGSVCPFQVHVAPIATGSSVIEDPNIWTSLSEGQRATTGLEMEAAALGLFAHAQRDFKLDAIVMKGVMDFATDGRTDDFKEFAARASAECLVSFLRREIATPPRNGIDDILGTGGPQQVSSRTPSALLRPSRTGVPFSENGRQELLNALEAWCSSDDPVSVQTVYGAGGMGKTRLALEFTARKSVDGWAAGVLKSRLSTDWAETLVENHPRSIVVLDYAESRQNLRDLLDQIASAGRTTAKARVRVLLLARNVGDWWKSLSRHHEENGNTFFLAPPIALNAVATTLERRVAEFDIAVGHFGRVLEKPVPNGPRPTLDDARYARILFIHMAALAFVEGMAATVTSLLDTIVNHEERFWISSSGSDIEDAQRRFLARQVVASATLSGGHTDRRDAIAAMSRMIGRNVEHADELMLRTIHRVYEVEGSGGAYLPALAPDLIGEMIVLRVAVPALSEDVVSPDWIRAAVSVDAESVRHALEVLGRTSIEHPRVLRDWMASLITENIPERVNLAVDATIAVGMRGAFSELGSVLAACLEAGGDATIARSLGERPLRFRSLAAVAEWQTRIESSVAEVEGGTSVDHKRRRACALAAVGRYADAAAIEREILATLDAAPDASVSVQRARALKNLGDHLSDSGDALGALAPSAASVALWGNIAMNGSADARYGYADALHSYGSRLGSIGQTDDGLRETQKAIAIYSGLESFAARLASVKAMENIAIFFRMSNRHIESSAAIENAMEAMKTMATASPDDLVEDLARVHMNMSTILMDSGRWPESLEYARTASSYYERLAFQGSRYEEPYARALTNLASRLIRMGQPSEALATADLAVTALRAQSGVGATLACALNILSIAQSKSGLHLAALTTCSESYEGYDALVAAGQVVYRVELANVAMNRGLRWRSLGDMQKAVADAVASVSAFRSLVADGEPHQQGLARCLQNASDTYLAAGRPSEALVAALESVSLLEALSAANPAPYAHDLTWAKGSLSRARQSTS